MSHDSVFYVDGDWCSNGYSFSELPDIYENLIFCIKTLIKRGLFKEKGKEEQK